MAKKPVEVVAIRQGYRENRIVEVGEHFSIEPQKVSKRWMAKVGTPEYEAFMRAHNPAPLERDKITGEQIAAGGIAEELALVTAKANALESQVAELTAENALMRTQLADLQGSPTPAPTPAKKKAETDETAGEEDTTRVRRRAPKTEVDA